MKCVRCGESYHVSIIRQFGFYKCRICGKDYCNNCVYVVSTYFGKLVRFRVCKAHIDALINSVSVPSKAQEHVQVRVTDVGKCDFPSCEKEKDGGHVSYATKRLVDVPSPSQELKDGESKKILCVKCNKPIHIKDFGAIAKQGLYHGDCIVDELTQEPKEDERREK